MADMMFYLFGGPLIGASCVAIMGTAISGQWITLVAWVPIVLILLIIPLCTKVYERVKWK